MYEEISLEESWQLLQKHIPCLGWETIAVTRALGRVLPEDVYAPYSLPPQAQSAVDGYALGTGFFAAGSTFILPNAWSNSTEMLLNPGQARYVDTGEVLPPGTMAVVPQEKAQRESGDLRVLENIKDGQNIKTAGEDFQQGELLLKAHSSLDPASLAVLTAFGIAEVKALCQPRVAVICLANNIVPWWIEPGIRQMRDSNTPLLTAFVQQQGGLVTAVHYASQLGMHTLEVLKQLLSEVELLLMVGGTYQSGKNISRLLMEAVGAQICYWGVPVQPGSHTGAGRVGNCLLLSLSGNPAACAVGYHLFAAPVLRAMQGMPWAYQPIKARCRNAFPKPTGSRRLVRGRLSWQDDSWEIEFLPGQKPSMLRSLLNCNALVDLPAGSAPVQAGDEVKTIVLSHHPVAVFLTEKKAAPLYILGGERC